MSQTVQHCVESDYPTSGNHGNVGVLDRFRQALFAVLGNQRRVLGRKLFRLLGELIGIAKSHQRNDFQLVGILSDYIERLRTDGAGTAQYSNFFHITILFVLA